MKKLLLLLAIVSVMFAFSCKKEAKKEEVKADVKKEEVKTDVKKEDVKADVKTEVKSDDVKISYDGGEKVVAGNGKVSFFVPTGWAKQDNSDMWIDKATGSSANIQVEASDMAMDKYLELSLTNMKAAIPSYKEKTKEIKKLNGKEMAFLLGDMNMYNQDMTLYSIVMDISGTKYVLTTGGLKSEFEKNKATFDKVVASYKAE